jgi:tRNA (cytidine/uridine-2'-O-)-methyltransferase
MNVVLVEPEIPPNTGNIARLCAATKTGLHLIEPLGFRLDNRALRRAGMDYWRHVSWKKWPDWATFHHNTPRQAAFWFVESGGPLRYTDVAYGPEDYLVFGRETAGLPRRLLKAHRSHWLRLPMFNPKSRSLNLSNCVAIVLFEALRQHAFRGELKSAT